MPTSAASPATPQPVGADAHATFRRADRLRRAHPGSAAGLLLRAFSARMVGDAHGMEADVARALEADATDPIVNQALLNAPDERHRVAGATGVVDDVRADRAATRAAVRTLFAAGRSVVCGPVSRTDAVRGWCAWSEGQTAEIAVETPDGVVTLTLAADAAHPLAGPGTAAADFAIVAPAGLTVAARAGGDEARRAVVTPNARRAAVLTQASRNGTSGLCVIVPVYDDVAATADCLEALAAEAGGPDDVRVIMVNDAAPDPRMGPLLRAFRDRHGFELLEHARNAGFVAAVNHALSRTTAEDVVLLNADALPPPGAIARLAALARQDGIGVLVPFSNHGEFTSFPRPHVSNPFETLARIVEIDAAARAANGDALVDLPSASGFCMVVRRACLDAVGPLSTLYVRGYCEDADLCLAAREKGFRVVCATGVYVGHAGGRSFGAEKRRLVLRNRRVLERRFPHYRAESVAWAAADPLAPARRAAERLLRPANDVLCVVADGRDPLAAQLAVREDDGPALVATFEERGAVITLTDPAGGPPQDLAFALTDARQRLRLRRYFAQAKVRAFRLVDPHRFPPALLTLAFEQEEAPLEVAVTSGPARDEGEEADDPALPGFAWPASYAPIRSLEASDAMAAAFTRQLYGRAAAVAPRTSPSAPSSSTVRAKILGMLAPVAGAEQRRLAEAVAGRLNARGDGWSAEIVAPDAADDEGRPTRARLEETWTRLVANYGVGALFLADRQRGFWLIDAIAGRLGLPALAFDWSGGRLDARGHAFDRDNPANALIETHMGDDDVADAVSDWIDTLGAAPHG